MRNCGWEEANEELWMRNLRMTSSSKELRMRNCVWEEVNEELWMSTVVNEAFWMRHFRMRYDHLWMRYCGWGVVEKKHLMRKYYRPSSAMVVGEDQSEMDDVAPWVSSEMGSSASAKCLQIPFGIFWLFGRCLVWAGFDRRTTQDNQQRVVPKVLVAWQHLLLFTTWNKRNRAELNYRDQRDCSS